MHPVARRLALLAVAPLVACHGRPAPPAESPSLPEVPSLPAPAPTAFAPTVASEVIVLGGDPERPVRVLGTIAVTVDSGTAPRDVAQRLRVEAAKLGAHAIAIIDSRDSRQAPRWVRVDDYVPTLPVVRGAVTVPALALRFDTR